MEKCSSGKKMKNELDAKFKKKQKYYQIKEKGNDCFWIKYVGQYVIFF